MWQGETVFIIGGGPSLRGFDWAPLRHRAVIGCNDAYTLGEWVDVVYFGDAVWYQGYCQFRGHRGALQNFPGLLVSCATEEFADLGTRVKWLRRESAPGSLSSDSWKVNWYSSTGASAIHLAMIFGATQIVLLGFDMKSGKSGESNWHVNLKDPKFTEGKFKKFQGGFDRLEAHLDEIVGVQVLNAGPDSALDNFPHVNLESVL